MPLSFSASWPQGLPFACPSTFPPARSISASASTTSTRTAPARSKFPSTSRTKPSPAGAPVPSPSGTGEEAKQNLQHLVHAAFVLKGHGFIRAEKDQQQPRALAPEGRFWLEPCSKPSYPALAPDISLATTLAAN